jgi:hypothetical protein
LNPNILDIMSECCSNGYSGFSIPINDKCIDYYKNQVDKKYSDMIMYYKYEYYFCFKLKGIGNGIICYGYRLKSLFI